MERHCEQHWWKEKVIYQIYPRSFKDSNSDGIGDIQGIIEKLDYLKWLGVGAVWLCPIYDSPNYDMGYDIRDYEAIMAEFGTMSDFEELLEGLHKRGIKLIMDLVVNHTSDEHKWFIESRKSKDSPYRDFYIWRRGKNGAEPNNWASFFMPSAWTYDDAAGEWYLHLFSDKQPDLNWENPSLREKIYEMINGWLDKGIDGFRMDVINVIAKKEGLPDCPGESQYVFADNLFANQPRLHDHLREMRKRCFDGRDCMCVGEAPCVNIKTASELVDPSRRELDMLFHFELVDIDSGPGGKWDIIPFEIMRFKKIMSSWQKGIAWNSLFLGNHDQPRPVSRFVSWETEEARVRSAKMLATVMYLQKGTPFIFQGEEIGMTNMPFEDVSELRDVESINFYNQSKIFGSEETAWQAILKKGRDNSRTPMQWSSEPMSGFSGGDPWIRVNPNYEYINVKSAMEDEDSILHYYRNLIAIRAENVALIYGEYEEILSEQGQIYAYTRTFQNEVWVILCNMTQDIVKVSMPAHLEKAEIILTNVRNKNYDKSMLGYEARLMRVLKD